MSSPFFEEMLSSDDPVKSKYTNETLGLTPDAYSVYFFLSQGKGAYSKQGAKQSSQNFRTKSFVWRNCALTAT